MYLKNKSQDVRKSKRACKVSHVQTYDWSWFKTWLKTLKFTDLLNKGSRYLPSWIEQVLLMPDLVLTSFWRYFRSKRWCVMNQWYKKLKPSLTSPCWQFSSAASLIIGCLDSYRQSCDENWRAETSLLLVLILFDAFSNWAPQALKHENTECLSVLQAEETNAALYCLDEDNDALWSSYVHIYLLVIYSVFLCATSALRKVKVGLTHIDLLCCMLFYIVSVLTQRTNWDKELHYELWENGPMPSWKRNVFLELKVSFRLGINICPGWQLGTFEGILRSDQWNHIQRCFTHMNQGLDKVHSIISSRSLNAWVEPLVEVMKFLYWTRAWFSAGSISCPVRPLKEECGLEGPNISLCLDSLFLDYCISFNNAPWITKRSLRSLY